MSYRNFIFGVLNIVHLYWNGSQLLKSIQFYCSIRINHSILFKDQAKAKKEEMTMKKMLLPK